MERLTIGFDRPEYLLLLLLVPVLWVLSFRTLALLGRVRRLLAIALRTFVLLLIIAALSEMQLERATEKVTVIYVLDQSDRNAT